MDKVLFLGCGKMGSIILNNLIEQKSFKTSQISVLKKSDKDRIEKIKYFKKTSELPNNYKADLLFICIKPQESEKILREIKEREILSEKTILISILAGKKIEFFEEIFGKKSKIIRSMPNLPIADNFGIFSFMANKNLLKKEIKELKIIFEKFGHAFELKKEEQFDAATALFGSGPAYIFLLQEIFQRISLEFKINKTETDKLVKTLFLGSSFMSKNSSQNFQKLKQTVTSKGGTTAAGLEVLEKNHALEKLFKKAITAAFDKSKELSN